VPGAAAAPEEVFVLPVPLFKHHEMRSSDEIVKVLTSSGTSGQAPSRIYLDRETAALQTRVLVKIVRDFIGSERLPMLIVDSPATVRRREAFSARAAGILGFANFGREHTYLLDEGMIPNRQALETFVAKHAGRPLLIFGFTFMVWKYLYEPFKDAGIDLSRAILIHGGGWKKLADEAVSAAAFKEALQKAFGLRRVHDYYGMVEQVGSIFMGCEAGHLHTTAYADVVVRDPLTLAPLPVRRRGLVSLLSIVPSSYPGHALLSEDIGEWLGTDDCPCGRKGRYFRIHGRAERAEVRGCSDTFEVRG
jgi:hypothetical protein